MADLYLLFSSRTSQLKTGPGWHGVSYSDILGHQHSERSQSPSEPIRSQCPAVAAKVRVKAPRSIETKELCLHFAMSLASTRSTDRQLPGRCVFVEMDRLGQDCEIKDGPHRHGFNGGN